MANERLERLLKYYSENPNDPFIIYGLALEYRKSGQQKEAWQYFKILLINHPDYLPTYYQAAEFAAEELGHLEEARQIYQTGLEKCRKQGDNFAQRELQSAYENFLFENDLD